MVKSPSSRIKWWNKYRSDAREHTKCSRGRRRWNHWAYLVLTKWSLGSADLFWSLVSLDQETKSPRLFRTFFADRFSICGRGAQAHFIRRGIRQVQSEGRSSACSPIIQNRNLLANDCRGDCKIV